MFLLQDSGVDRVLARLTGPMHARLIIQPLMAICLGIRDGLADAKAGAPPFLVHLITEPGDRVARAITGFRRMRVPITLAVILDMIVQFMILDRVHLLGALLFGACVMGLPYCLARALASRIATSRMAKHVTASAGR